ncbi:hypothetical protein PsYK624_136680 [Phanerochaete sordida]|uniref:Uncharacterized protein n=1 Tax=Phanerochaete sordida TaxID=48140 RepID=A0A9P3LK83_9APHY|nr:hypothetical protein PsYK624_136680 [Phanerochaete sordida]
MESSISLVPPSMYETKRRGGPGNERERGICRRGCAVIALARLNGICKDEHGVGVGKLQHGLVLHCLFNPDRTTRRSTRSRDSWKHWCGCCGAQPRGDALGRQYRRIGPLWTDVPYLACRMHWMYADEGRYTRAPASTTG